MHNIRSRCAPSVLPDTVGNLLYIINIIEPINNITIKIYNPTCLVYLDGLNVIFLRIARNPNCSLSPFFVGNIEILADICKYG